MQPSWKAEIKEICSFIKTQQWDKLILFADKLISQVGQGTVSPRFISKLSTSIGAIAAKEAFMHELIHAIAALLKDAAMFAMAGNAADALDAAKHIREILLTTQELSHAASEEKLSPILLSQIVQIDTINGRPIYTIK